eukprot:Blabericola_migrator_1__12266@NODE_765_length_6607_cov_284_868043_g545_i0_p5_GENE_NODE_765_length_6607_cov_284_868043_g545_i0NODE_765_length_6607_cov_284_868043_g545_i0_p5_ORF_typecomplete_len114_score2_78PseudoU_synth_1/PF01416_20/63PseudoU_synth_1/PF01416_20/0_018_NODE_765_length_6607_cov_284_868043_g545_i0416757
MCLSKCDSSPRGRMIMVRLRVARQTRSYLGLDHYDYCTILNAILPRSVRVLEAVRVPLWFDARFHCLYRAYKYFFPTTGLNLDLVRAAASQFLGEHDFRNFCKIDPQTNKTFR